MFLAQKKLVIVWFANIAFEILTNFLPFYCEQGRRLAGKRTEAFIQCMMKTLLQLCCPFEGCPTIWARWSQQTQLQMVWGSKWRHDCCLPVKPALSEKRNGYNAETVHIWTFISEDFLFSHKLLTPFGFIVFYFRLLVPSGGPQNRSFQTNSLLLSLIACFCSCYSCLAGFCAKDDLSNQKYRVFFLCQWKHWNIASVLQVSSCNFSFPVIIKKNLIL